MSAVVKIRCHFDGKSIVPDEPVNLPTDQPLIVHVQRGPSISPQPHSGQHFLDCENLTSKSNEDSTPSDSESADAWIDDHAIDDPTLPKDGARQHDHYLYGTPKKS